MKLSELKNIGKTVETRLKEIDIFTKSDLEKLGSAKAYKWMSQKWPNKHLPVCYYLYSLEGALQNKHWDDLTEVEKQQLRIEAGVGY